MTSITITVVNIVKMFTRQYKVQCVIGHTNRIQKLQFKGFLEGNTEEEPRTLIPSKDGIVSSGQLEVLQDLQRSGRPKIIINGTFEAVRERVTRVVLEIILEEL